MGSTKRIPQCEKYFSQPSAREGETGETPREGKTVEGETVEE
jgi:hypothetical protein